MVDFVFDDERLSDHGFVIGYIGDSMTWEGGNVEFTSVKPVNSDKLTFYTSAFNNPLVCNFTIIKNPCLYSDQNDMELTQEEQADIMRWLVRPDGYHWLQFDEDDYEDVWFNCYFTVAPNISSGRLIGLNLTVTTDSPYGYSKLYKRTWNSQNGALTFENYSNKPGIIYPKCSIKPISDGNIIIQSGLLYQGCTTVIENVDKNVKMVLDGANDLAQNVDPNFFNYVFPVIENSYDNRTTRFSSALSTCDFVMDIEYRLIKWVVAVV